MSEVYVVTNSNLGWDCVVGVFNADSVPRKHLEKIFKEEEGYSVFWHDVEKDTFEYE